MSARAKKNLEMRVNNDGEAYECLPKFRDDFKELFQCSIPASGLLAGLSFYLINLVHSYF